MNTTQTGDGSTPARLFSIALLLIAMAGCTGLSEAAQFNAALDKQLSAMGVEDQAVRAKLEPFLASGDFRSEGLKAVSQEMATVDSRNLIELEKIIEQFGWPGTDLVGIDASNSAFLILQHSPLETQKKLLPVFKEAVSAGKARAADLAMLEDRILIRDGKKQIYGTQVTAGPDGVPRLDPIEDPKNIDARRKAVGISTIDEYLDRLEIQIGRTIDRSALEAESN